MPSTAIQADLDAIMQRNRAAVVQREREERAKAAAASAEKEAQPVVEEPPKKVIALPWARKTEEPQDTSASDGTDESSEHHEGAHQKQGGMKPPQPVPGMLNKELATAAAKKYSKSQKRIQQACAQLDDPNVPNYVEPEKARFGACTIM